MKLESEVEQWQAADAWMVRAACQISPVLPLQGSCSTRVGMYKGCWRATQPCRCAGCRAPGSPADGF